MRDRFVHSLPRTCYDSNDFHAITRRSPGRIPAETMGALSRSKTGRMRREIVPPSHRRKAQRCRFVARREISTVRGTEPWSITRDDYHSSSWRVITIGRTLATSEGLGPDASRRANLEPVLANQKIPSPTMARSDRTTSVISGRSRAREKMHGTMSCGARACVFLARVYARESERAYCVCARERKVRRLGKISLGLSHALCMS